MTKRVWLQIEA